MTTKDLATTNTEIAPSNGTVQPSKKDVDMISDEEFAAGLQREVKSAAYHKEYNSRPEVMKRNKQRQEFNKLSRQVYSAFGKGKITGDAAKAQIAALKVQFYIVDKD